MANRVRSGRPASTHRPASGASWLPRPSWVRVQPRWRKDPRGSHTRPHSHARPPARAPLCLRLRGHHRCASAYRNSAPFSSRSRRPSDPPAEPAWLPRPSWVRVQPRWWKDPRGSHTRPHSHACPPARAPLCLRLCGHHRRASALELPNVNFSSKCWVIVH